MTWIKDQYQKVKGELDINFAGCCTGKHIKHGGIAGRTESTGMGVYYAIRELLQTKSFLEKVGDGKPGIRDKTFAVQGFGNVGYWAAHYIHRDGGKVTTIIEYNTAIHKIDGFGQVCYLYPMVSRVHMMFYILAEEYLETRIYITNLTRSK